MILQQGDEFASRNPQSLGLIINTFQKIQSVDNESDYTHTGVIISATGQTFEARNSLDKYHLNDYKGQKVLIARYNQMSPDLYMKGWIAISQYMGKTYPYFRLILHALRLAKYVHWETPVCSELTSKFEVAIGARHNWWGVNPDNLVDVWKDSRRFNIIFEGVWE